MAQNRTNTSKKTREFNPPAMIAWHVSDRGEGKKGFWTRIGAAWSFKEGEGFTLNLDLTPANGGRIVLMPPKAKDEAGGEEPQSESGGEAETQE